MALLASCDDNKKDLPDGTDYRNDPASLKWYFKGPARTLQDNGGTPYTQQNVITCIVFNADYTHCDLFLFNVAFAAQMPLIDMEVYGLEVESTSGVYKITGDAIVPKIGEREFPVYTIFGFEGYASVSELEFTLTCGSGADENNKAYPIEYQSVAYELQEGDIDENVGKEVNTIHGGLFEGTMEVTQSDGTVFTANNTVFEFLFYDDKKETGSIVMYDVTFSENMPYPLDEMSIDGIECLLTSNGYVLSGDGIVPVWNNSGVDRYTVTELQGTLTSANLTLSMVCGDYPLSFSGSLIEEE